MRTGLIRQKNVFRSKKMSVIINLRRQGSGYKEGRQTSDMGGCVLLWVFGNDRSKEYFEGDDGTARAPAWNPDTRGANRSVGKEGVDPKE